MFCPQCQSEYRSGFTRCEDCNVDLVDRLPLKPAENPADHAEPVVIRIYTSPFEAEVAVSALDAAGIPAVIQSSNSEGDTFARSLTEGVKVLVRPLDVAAAEDVLTVEGLDVEIPDDEVGDDPL